MKNLKHIGVLYIVIALLVSTIFIMKCTEDKKDVIIIPEKKGTLEDNNPKEILKDSIFIYKLKDTIIKYNRPIDTVYIKEYIKADNNTKLEKYKEAIANRTYQNVIEDSLVKIDYTAETQGKLLDIKLDYVIKPITIIQPKPKESVFALYGGAGLKTTTKLGELTPAVKLGIQGKKGNIISLNYSSDGTIEAGYMFRLLNVKK